MTGAACAAVMFLTAFPTAAAGEDLAHPPMAGSSIWTSGVRRKMLQDALKIAPPALARILERHAAELTEGMALGEIFEGQPHHRQDGDTPGVGAAAALAAVARRAVEAMSTHRPMRELAYYLGLLAHFAADLSDPTLTAPEGTAALFTRDYASYAERNLDRFPVVFYGYPVLKGAQAVLAVPAPFESLEAEGHAAAGEARSYYAHLARAYELSGGSSHSFDVRSIPFGVASLCYSRGVTNIARAWLHVWRSARGDLTGTPHLRWEDPEGTQASTKGEVNAPANPHEQNETSKN